MDAQDIQKQLNISQVYELLSHLGGDPRWESDDVIVSRTICHNGGSHKLYYYDNSKRFTCYTGDCGYGFSIFDLVQYIHGYDFITSLNFVKQFFGIYSQNILTKSERVEMSFFKKFEKEDKTSKEHIFDRDVLNHFYPDIFHESWIEDNISPKSMSKYDIHYSITTNQIIIPHKNIGGDLIGVRVRNLNEEDLEEGRKYMPLIYNGEMYNHNTGNYLYGVYESKHHIKKHKKIILFEGEKSCMQIDTMFPQYNIAVALSGSNLSDKQIETIHSLGVEEVIIALDKEFEELDSREEWLYQRAIRQNMINSLLPFYKVSVIWDRWDILDYKDSPSDKGKKAFIDLYKNRIKIVA